MIRYTLPILVLVLVGCGTPPKVLSVAPQVAADSKWHVYEAYLSRVVGKVQKQWERSLKEMRRYPATGEVIVVFTINAEGKIERIDEVKNGSSHEGALACVSAITAPSPYGAWTDEMIAILGPQQKMTFTFYYQD
jgi:hypothetical protein